jgi:uncharacterized protein YbjT (DUF2867 family)
MRTAIIAGATGLVGRELVKTLTKSEEYSSVHIIVRRPFGESHPKLTEHIIDFEKLEDFDPGCRIDDFYCTLGTTMKKAGGKEAFRTVDFDYVIYFAKLSKRLDSNCFCVVSAMGANSKSSFFYNRVKGEMERALKNLTLKLKNLVIIRPSLLTGDRKEKRFGESIAETVMNIFNPLIPANYRSVPAKNVANAMYRMTLTEGDDTFYINSGQIHKIRES